LAAATAAPRPVHGARYDPEHADLAAAVKATYLHKFTPFVEWPVEAFDAPNSPYEVCVIGDPEFEELVRRAVDGLAVDGRGFVTTAPTSVEQAGHCHIVY